MSKTVYITRQALIELFNTKYGANFSPDTEFIFDEETVEAKTYTDYLKDQLSLTEKALELACEMICGLAVFDKLGYEKAVAENCEYFKTKAKEIIGNEQI